MPAFATNRAWIRRFNSEVIGSRAEIWTAFYYTKETVFFYIDKLHEERRKFIQGIGW